MKAFLSADAGLLVVATGCLGIAGVVSAACIKNGTANCAWDKCRCENGWCKFVEHTSAACQTETIPQTTVCP